MNGGFDHHPAMIVAGRAALRAFAAGPTEPLARERRRAPLPTLNCNAICTTFTESRMFEMLNLNATDLSNEKKTRTTQVRHGDSLTALIKRATSVLGVDKSIFIRNAIAKEAQRVIEDSSRHILTAEDARLFAAALDKPPAIQLRARKAAASYRRRVINAE